jgi:hypothetical protein
MNHIHVGYDRLVGVVQLMVGTSSAADLVSQSWLEIDVDSVGHVFVSTSFRGKGVEGIFTTTDGFVRGHLVVRLDVVLKAEEFPVGITDLDTSLIKVNVDYFTHFEIDFFVKKKETLRRSKRFGDDTISEDGRNCVWLIQGKLW